MDYLQTEQPTTDVHSHRIENENPPFLPEIMPLRIGHYKPLEQIGSGGMGTIYRAEHLFLKRDFAVKVINPVWLDDPTVTEHFSTETLLMGSLEHPNIVRTTDAGNDDGRLFLVMELLHGRDLAQYVRDQGPLPIGEALEYLKQAAQGLAFAHRKGIIHRDVKPSNIFLTDDGVIKLLDLGLAKTTGQRASMNDGRLVGSPGFMAPEQIRSGVFDIRSDIYSLGCTFYFMLTGHLPFEAPEYPDMQSVLDAQVGKAIPSLHIYRDDLNREAERLVRKMTAKNPSRRYQTMEELASALEKPVVYISRRKKVDHLPLLRRMRLTVSAMILAVLAVIPLTLSGLELCQCCSAQKCNESKEKHDLCPTEHLSEPEFFADTWADVPAYTNNDIQ